MGSLTGFFHGANASQLVSLPPMAIPENRNLGYSHGVGTSVLGRQPSVIPPEDLAVARAMGRRVAEVAYQIHG